MFRASAISISKDLVKEADSIFYHFIYNGKDKVKRMNGIIPEVENGGLNMLDTKLQIKLSGTTNSSVLIRNLFTEEILRMKAPVKSETYFQLMMNNVTLNISFFIMRQCN